MTERDQSEVTLTGTPRCKSEARFDLTSFTQDKVRCTNTLGHEGYHAYDIWRWSTGDRAEITS